MGDLPLPDNPFDPSGWLPIIGMTQEEFDRAFMSPEPIIKWLPKLMRS